MPSQADVQPLISTKYGLIFKPKSIILNKIHLCNPKRFLYCRLQDIKSPHILDCLRPHKWSVVESHDFLTSDNIGNEFLISDRFLRTYFFVKNDCTAMC